MTVPVIQRSVVAHGWLRRPELDGRNYQTWELPNGQLQAVQKGHVPTLLSLQIPPLLDLMNKVGGSEA
jgi:hypothetical protein